MPPSCFPTPAPSIPLGPHPIQVERRGFDLVGGGTGDPPVLSQSIEQEAVGNPTLTHGPQPRVHMNDAWLLRLGLYPGLLKNEDEQSSL